MEGTREGGGEVNHREEIGDKDMRPRGFMIGIRVESVMF